MREMTEVERAWVGAMIEAEGSVGFTNKKKYGQRHSYVRVTNTDPEILSAFLRATEVGKIYAWLPKETGKKWVFIWQVGKKEDVNSLVRQCLAYAPKLAGDIMRM